MAFFSGLRGQEMVRLSPTIEKFGSTSTRYTLLQTIGLTVQVHKASKLSFSIFNSDSLLFEGEANRGVTQLRPTVFSTPDYSTAVIFLESSSDYSWGQEVFIYEDASLYHLGYINMACLDLDRLISLADCMLLKKLESENVMITLITLGEVVESPSGQKHHFNSHTLLIELSKDEITYHWEEED